MVRSAPRTGTRTTSSRGRNCLIVFNSSRLVPSATTIKQGASSVREGFALAKVLLVDDRVADAVRDSEQADLLSTPPSGAPQPLQNLAPAGADSPHCPQKLISSFYAVQNPALTDHFSFRILNLAVRPGHRQAQEILLSTP